MADAAAQEEREENVVRKRFEKLKDSDDSSGTRDSRRSSTGSDASISDNLSIGEAISAAKTTEFRSRAEELSQKLQDKFESQFEEMIENLTEEMRRCSTVNVKDKTLQSNAYDEEGLKLFFPRESLLTELLEISHFQSIYNVFVALLFVFFLNTMVYDYFGTGRIFNQSTMTWSFGKMPEAIHTWVYMKIYILLMYPIFLVYKSIQYGSSLKIPTAVWCIAYVGYLLFFIYFPVKAVFECNLPPVSAMIVTVEQVRLFMKVHAFVRVNSDKVYEHAENCRKAKKDDTVIVEDFEFPGFSQYLYFLYIPTLIYRDSYPMTPYVRWDFVVKNFLQVLGCIAYTYFILARFCVPAFENTGKEKGNMRVLLLSAFSCMLPGMLVLLVAFFAVLHSWMNAFAEMTRFADRMFYRDWWTSNSFASYYRMWNVVVHDWLYAYIYKDFHSLFGKQRRGTAAISVFIISAVVHEYILAISFRFFYPALLFMFGGVGLVFFFLKPRKGSRNPLWNIYLWVSLTMGSGILMTMYSVEWYASQNCKRSFDEWSDYLLPYSFDSTCVSWEWR